CTERSAWASPSKSRRRRRMRPDTGVLKIPVETALPFHCTVLGSPTFSETIFIVGISLDRHRGAAGPAAYDVCGRDAASSRLRAVSPVRVSSREEHRREALMADTDPLLGHGRQIIVREDWLALTDEPVLEPALPIIDPHHHLWQRAAGSYLLPELLADT